MIAWRAIAVSVLLGALAAGCDDDYCLSGEASRCDGEFVQVCEGYSWVDEEDCEQSADGPYCVLFFGDARCSDRP
jgi:hypothetical protein